MKMKRITPKFPPHNFHAVTPYGKVTFFILNAASANVEIRVNTKNPFIIDGQNVAATCEGRLENGKFTSIFLYNSFFGEPTKDVSRDKIRAILLDIITKWYNDNKERVREVQIALYQYQIHKLTKKSETLAAQSANKKREAAAIKKKLKNFLTS